MSHGDPAAAHYKTIPIHCRMMHALWQQFHILLDLYSTANMMQPWSSLDFPVQTGITVLRKALTHNNVLIQISMGGKLALFFIRGFVRTEKIHYKPITRENKV